VTVHGTQAALRSVAEGDRFLFEKWGTILVLRQCHSSGAVMPPVARRVAAWRLTAFCSFNERINNYHILFVKNSLHFRGLICSRRLYVRAHRRPGRLLYF
jgi:hypothetical protein